MKKLGMVLFCLIFLEVSVRADNVCNWPMFRGDLARSGNCDSGCTPGNHELLWFFKTDGAVESSPAIVNDRILVGSYDTFFYCIDAISGKLIWKFKSDGGIKSSPCVDEGKVYFGCDNIALTTGKFYCLNADSGELVWSADFAKKIESSPLVVNGKVYFGCADGYMYCLDKLTGDKVWSYEDQ